MSALDIFSCSPAVPSDKGPAVEAPWWAMKGEWDKAHECVQAHEGELDCDAVHAHLHRQESDLSNADYWYRRAGDQYRQRRSKKRVTCSWPSS